MTEVRLSFMSFVKQQCAYMISDGEPIATDVNIEMQSLICLALRCMNRSAVMGGWSTTESLNRFCNVPAEIPAVDCVQSSEGGIQEIRAHRVELELVYTCAYAITPLTFVSQKHGGDLPCRLGKERYVRRRWRGRTQGTSCVHA